MKKEIKILRFLFVMMLFSFTSSCMKADMGENIPLYWSSEIIANDGDGNEITYYARYKNFGGGAGNDGVFGTGDDDILFYITVSEIDEEISMSNYYTFGEDGFWFTEDDSPILSKDNYRYGRPIYSISQFIESVENGTQFNGFVNEIRYYNNSSLSSQSIDISEDVTKVIFRIYDENNSLIEKSVVVYVDRRN